MKNLEEIKIKLSKYGQEHLLNFYSELSEKEQQELLEQIDNLDLEQITKLFETRNETANLKDEITPIKFVDKLKLSSSEIEEYEKIGKDIIAKGKFAFVTMAGGQGTRLGHDGPKGTYKLGINPDKSLFEIMADSLKVTKKEYNVYVPWYIMTSRQNNDDTIEFFEANNYFGYPKELVTFFKQGELPMVDEHGKILLEEKGKVKEGADGHGGVFAAMHNNKIIENMKNKGIEWIFIGGIDNVLLKMIDPLFLGMAANKGVLIASKSIVKANPEEKVGVFCKRNNRPSVIEYTEITKNMALMCDENGELLYGESHILCNLFNIKELEMVSNENLQYHTAFKKSSYIESTGREFIPLTANSYKFEAFIFDAFSRADDMLILRTLREEEFAPVKNKEGVDSPETARALYNNYWRNIK